MFHVTHTAYVLSIHTQAKWCEFRFRLHDIAVLDPPLRSEFLSVRSPYVRLQTIKQSYTNYGGSFLDCVASYIHGPLSIMR